MTDQAFTIWLTGLPCSGKSTLARELEKRLVALGLRVQVLDGDEVREGLSRGLGFSREDRNENIRRIAFLARLLNRNAVVTIIAAISPHRDARVAARGTINRFVEVYVKCPVEVCIQRDAKGLYKKALAEEIQHFTGVSDCYEEPEQPEVIVETDREGIDQSVEKILSGLCNAGSLSAASPEAVDCVFVLSLGRSGSTFLQRTLQEVEGLICYEREWNIATLYSDLLDANGRAPGEEFARRYEQDSKAVPEVAKLLAARLGTGSLSLPDFLSAIRDIVAGPGKTLLIKTTDLQNLWVYKRLFPNARFILNIRHPLMYLHSWNLFWVAFNYHLYPAQWLRPIHSEGALRVQQCFLRAALYRRDEQVMVVRLEDFSMTDPDAAAQVLKRMVEFCGVSIDAAQARHLIARRHGINNRFDYVDKDKAYAAFGVTRMERMALERATPFVAPFYPNFPAELAASPRTYPMLRLLHYARKQVGKLPASRRPLAWLKWCFKAATLLRAIVR